MADQQQDLFHPNQAPLPYEEVSLPSQAHEMAWRYDIPLSDAQALTQSWSQHDHTATKQSLLDALSEVLTQQHQTAFESTGWQSLRAQATELTQTLDALQARLETLAPPRERGQEQGMEY